MEGRVCQRSLPARGDPPPARSAGRDVSTRPISRPSSPRLRSSRPSPRRAASALEALRRVRRRVSALAALILDAFVPSALARRLNCGVYFWSRSPPWSIARQTSRWCLPCSVKRTSRAAADDQVHHRAARRHRHRSVARFGGRVARWHAHGGRPPLDRDGRARFLRTVDRDAPERSKDRRRGRSRSSRRMANWLSFFAHGSLKKLRIEGWHPSPCSVPACRRRRELGPRRHDRFRRRPGRMAWRGLGTRRANLSCSPRPLRARARSATAGLTSVPDARAMILHGASLADSAVAIFDLASGHEHAR